MQNKSELECGLIYSIRIFLFDRISLNLLQASNFSIEKRGFFQYDAGSFANSQQFLVIQTGTDKPWFESRCCGISPYRPTIHLRHLAQVISPFSFCPLEENDGDR